MGRCIQALKWHSTPSRDVILSCIAQIHHKGLLHNNVVEHILQIQQWKPVGITQGIRTLHDSRHMLRQQTGHCIQLNTIVAHPIWLAPLRATNQDNCAYSLWYSFTNTNFCKYALVAQPFTLIVQLFSGLSCALLRLLPDHPLLSQLNYKRPLHNTT